MAETKFTDEVIDDLFSHHAPSMDQEACYNRIREGARQFARVIAENTPPSADQTTAIRRLRDTVAAANAAIALEGRG